MKDQIRQGATYYPSDPPDAWEALRSEVVSLRQSVIADLMLRWSASAPRETSVVTYRDDVRDLLAMNPEDRHRLMTHPAMLIWLRQAVAKSSSGMRAGGPGVDAVGGWLTDFASVRDRCVADGGPDGLTVAGSVRLKRHDVDPLVSMVSSPTYTFPTGSGSSAEEERMKACEAYPLEFFSGVADAALGRARAAWPALGDMFPRFVHTVVHVPDSEFRSASASRYTGLIFIAGDDRTLLEVEESLIHEFGHQVLYWVMETDPLFENTENGPDFTLPWSGSERDYYGFYHAFYIYTLLAQYYARVVRSRPETRAPAAKRLHEIGSGLELAIPMILSSGRFTPVGEVFTQNVCDSARAVVQSLD
ncbi:aKG-HExxH-type peptide beta-hydroxylase [Catenulispora yoronensis]|uniref:aKG-HExxH-type peptide beta-hydroxylase n=1 Tax=Catenulispora yoronensis TaxID=450799 RepID=UPI0031D3FEEC